MGRATNTYPTRVSATWRSAPVIWPDRIGTRGRRMKKPNRRKVNKSPARARPLGQGDEEAERQEVEEVPGQGGHQQAALAQDDQQVGVAALDAGDADELRAALHDHEGGQQGGHEPADEKR